MNVSYLIQLLLQAFALIVGIVVHESSHALAAWVLGDQTARARGRVSLNPLNHIDPFGTVILPLIMIAAGGPVFAYAKPVPVYLGNLKHPKRDEVIISLAGPASNLLLAGLAALVMRLALPRLLYSSVSTAAVYYFYYGCLYFMSVNLSLAFFNLIPLPPLDGSKVLVLFLKGRALETYHQIQRYAMPILLVVLYILPELLNIDLVGWYFDLTMYPLLELLLNFGLGW